MTPNTPTPNIKFSLTSLEDTAAFGAILGQGISLLFNENKKYPQALYLFGDLGLGKTTLTRSIVQVLPGSERAEVDSPSFTLCHHYPTTPPIFHGDLYRLIENSLMPEEFLDIPSSALFVLEWPENLQIKEYTEDRLDIFLSFSEKDLETLDNKAKSCEKKRRIIIKAHGQGGTNLLSCVENSLVSRFMLDCKI